MTSTPTPTIYRPATPADVPAITAIYAHAVRTGSASFEIEPPDEAEIARRMTALAASDHPYFVAESGGAVLGYAYAGPYRLRPAYRWTVEDSIYVAPSATRAGLGRALLFRLLLESEARGFRQMVAVIGDTENIASIELHRDAGFRLVGVLENVGFKHGRWLGSVLMQRSLGDGAATLPA
ncbi:GNAT family N-acetyltransferase [Rhodoplanes serenus]|uniref:GNAT family N-acetyltransferase n=1 Tax=Rhodoplanes serenus TaxID=200615 RepID=UPI000DACEDAE|nr:GNAT family N-acetyltransferase [Rhodoplanes serenus]RAI32013.1 GNAT family N-acetyltransferase [Rhodoplanes serenus]